MPFPNGQFTGMHPGLRPPTVPGTGGPMLPPAAGGGWQGGPGGGWGGPPPTTPSPPATSGHGTPGATPPPGGWSPPPSPPPHPGSYEAAVAQTPPGGTGTGGSNFASQFGLPPQYHANNLALWRNSQSPWNQRLSDAWSGTGMTPEQKAAIQQTVNKVYGSGNLPAFWSGLFGINPAGATP